MEAHSNPIRPPAGPRAITKNSGSTPTERYLAELAERTFLSLWSYPNLWRDQRANGAKDGDGKELCDLLVVFDEHLIIFSDKQIEYQKHQDPAVAWSRWYKASIKDSAKQVFGAERWIRKCPERIFLDARCAQRLPVKLAASDKLVIHRIIVARGAGAACREHFGGGSGSLMIAPGIIGDEHLIQTGAEPRMPINGNRYLPIGPFMIGQIEPSRGYIHVLDDVSLGVLLRNLNTVQDFVDYLFAKERIALSGRLVFAVGEEDLLAYYLQRQGTNRKHEFVLPANATNIAITEGLWEDFQENPQRIAQIEADEPSYLWDELIELFSFHALNDSQYYATNPGAAGTEPIVRFLAREPRIRRRILSYAIRAVVERVHRFPDSLLQARVVEPSHPGNPYYVFLALQRPRDSPYSEYREVRLKFLEEYMKIVKAMRPSAIDIVGIAFGTENSERQGGSEDLAYLDARSWSEADQRAAEKLQRETGFLKKVEVFHEVHKEYPDVVDQQLESSERHKGRNRNQPCFCASGLKYKRCHGK